jgi:DNA-binding MarR family transcriptional regulator
MKLKEELGLDQSIETVAHECLLNILYVGTMISKTSYVYFREYGITDAQFNVLIQLRYTKQSTLSQADLGRRLVVNKADMTGIVDRLEKAGLVERTDHPKDRRVNVIKITRNGRDMVNKLEPDYLEIVRKLMSGILKTDMKIIIRGMEKVRENIRREGFAR